MKGKEKRREEKEKRREACNAHLIVCQKVHGSLFFLFLRKKKHSFLPPCQSKSHDQNAISSTGIHLLASLPSTSAGVHQRQCALRNLVNDIILLKTPFSFLPSFLPYALSLFLAKVVVTLTDHPLPLQLFSTTHLPFSFPFLFHALLINVANPLQQRHPNVHPTPPSKDGSEGSMD